MHKKSLFIYSVMIGVELIFLILIAGHAKWSLNPYLTGVDAIEYTTIAKNLSENNAFSKSSIAPFIPNFFRLPGYPFWLTFIYLIFGSFKPAIFLGMAIFALSASLVYLIMREVFSEKLAFWSALIFAIEPRMAFSAPFLLSEQIFLPIFLLSIFFAVKFFNYQEKKNYLFLSAILLGLSSLTRGIVLYLWLVFIVVFFIKLYKAYSLGKILKTLGLATLVFILVISPWFIRNKLVLNTWQFSSGSGLVIYWGHLEILERYLGAPKELAYENLIKRADSLAGPNLETVEAANILTAEAFKEIKSHLGLYLRIYFSNLPLFFITDGYKGIASYVINVKPNYFNLGDSLIRFRFGEFSESIKKLSYGDLILPIFGRILWFVLTTLSFFGIFLSYKNMPQKRFPVAFFALLILYFAILTGPIGFEPRYRMPVNGFIIAFATVSVFHILKSDFKMDSPKKT